MYKANLEDCEIELVACSSFWLRGSSEYNKRDIKFHDLQLIWSEEKQ